MLRWLSTAPRRLAAIESMIGRSVRGLRAPIEKCAPAAELLTRRENIYREDLDLFDRFLRASTGLDPAVLEAVPSTASICNGILAPITVKDEPWGVLCVYSHSFRHADADAVGDRARNVMNRVGINRHFTDIFDIAAADYVPKPDASSFARLIETYGIDPKRAAMFDDMPRNLKPAADLGMKTVLVSSDHDWAQPTGDEDFIHHTTDRLADWLAAADIANKKTGT